jgi:hypothetical protein
LFLLFLLILLLLLLLLLLRRIPPSLTPRSGARPASP